MQRDYHIYFLSLLNILQEAVTLSWESDHIFHILSFSTITRSNCSSRDIHTSYVVSTPKIILKTSSFTAPRNHEMKCPSLLIHCWYCGLGFLFSSLFLISSTSFFLFNRWWRTSRPQTKRLIWLHRSGKFVVFNLIEMKQEH